MNINTQSVMTQAQALTIGSMTDRERAGELFDAVRAFRKQSEAQREETCRPLKDAYDSTKKPFDTFEKECKGHEQVLTSKMSVWDQEQARRARAEQARLQAIADKANVKILAKAEANGLDAGAVALKIAPVVVAPPAQQTTQAGTTITRQSRIVYGLQGVVDETRMAADDVRAEALLSRYPALFVLDWVAYRKLASTGMLDGVPGVDRREAISYVQGG